MKPTGTAHGRKVGVSVTLDPSLYEWAKANTGAGKPFANLSHALERGIALLQEHDEGKWIRAPTRSDPTKSDHP